VQTLFKVLFFIISSNFLSVFLDCKMQQAKNTELTDDEVIDRLKAGDSNRFFEVIYHRYHQRVVLKCSSLLKDKRMAEEMAKDIFSKVYEKLPSFKQKSTFSTWLYSITYNQCIDYLRQKKNLHYPSWNLEQELAELPSEAEQLSDINYDDLMSIMELIHPEEKALLIMKYLDDLSLKQISHAMRITENATKMRLKRARTRVFYLYRKKYLETGKNDHGREF
jgi:RNA polymerase sigma factor (sigma-70 family)